MVVDTQTLLVPEFTYDGLGPAAYWWVSRGTKQHPRGTRLADENGSLSPLPRYTGKTVVITLPDDKTIYDYDWFGVWCDEARVDFGSVQLPQNVIVPPSPRMLGVELEYKLNCEVLHDDLGFEIRWIMDGEDIVMQMVAKLDKNEYMSFGLSKNDSQSQMIDADAIVAWIDRHNRGHAVDYFLGSKEQCVGRRGSCPDARHSDGDDSVTLLNAANVNGYTMITFKRPQVGLDEKYDQHVYSDGPQAIVWAIGPLNNRDEVSYHGIMRAEGDVFLDFARPPQWNCPQPDDPKPTAHPPATTRKPTTTTTTTKPTTRKSSRKPTVPSTTSKKLKTTTPASGRRRNQYAAASRTSNRVTSQSKSGWKIPQIVCPADRTFKAQIGPAGGKKGYQAVTGDVGWGIAWYIDGILIPEITVQRGKTYTFTVEGGLDPNNLARQHPLYITDDPEGGYEHKTQTEKKKVKVFAGVARDRKGNFVSTAAGRMCEYKLPEDEVADSFNTFEEFQQNLELKCDRGKPGKLTFRPDENTPDLVYYQCYTHRFLGWKIHVVDSCGETSGSLDIGASFTSVKNITLQDVQDKYASDYKRGSSKQKLAAGNDYDPTSYRTDGTGNDEIPLNIFEDVPEIATAEEDDDGAYTFTKPSTFSTTEKQLYFRPSANQPYAIKNQYHYQYNPPFPTQRNYVKTTTTSTTTSIPNTKKAVYVKYPPTSAPERKRQSYTTRGYATTPRPSPKNAPKPRLTDSTKLYSIASPSSQEAIFQTKGHSVILSPAKSNGVRVTIFPSTNNYPVVSTASPLKTTTRSQIPWWKPIGEQKRPVEGSGSRQKAAQSVRNHVTVFQGDKKRLPTQSTRSPITINYHNGFLPIVIRSNGSFDRALVDLPPEFQLGHRTKDFANKKHVHVLVRHNSPRSQTIRRANGNNKSNFIKTPVGKFRLPSSPPRQKSVRGQSSEETKAAYLPLLIPRAPMNGSAKSNPHQSSLPVIPIVVPQKKGENVYVLHHVLSLITDSPTQAAKSSKNSNSRERKTRSADHHMNHKHMDDDHMNHSHDEHQDHKSDKSKSKNTSSSILPLAQLLSMCCLFVTFLS